MCEEDESGGGISIYNIGGVFIVIFVGIVAALVALAVEYWYFKYKRPMSRVSTGSDPYAKQLQVKQAVLGNNFNNTGSKDMTGFRTQFSEPPNGGSNGDTTHHQ